MIEITEEEARSVIWQLKDFADRLRKDADYYEKKAEELRKKYKVNK
jgi:hypothetical protein